MSIVDVEHSAFYPRVLIVGQSFDTSTGGGITISNLFKGWPKEKLAVISDLKYYPNADVCNQYYRLGQDEYRILWPLSILFKHRRASGEVNVDLGALASEMAPTQAWQQHTGHIHKQGSLWNLLYLFDKATGVEHVIRRLHLSPKLVDWVINFHPHIIYTQAGGLEVISLARQIIERIKTPYIIHMMDDWPTTLYADKILAPFIRRSLITNFLELLEHSSAFLGISQKMCDVYQKRYNRLCIPFHNPIEFSTWLPFSKKDWKTSTPFRLKYAGRVGTSLQTSLVDVCDAVQKVYQDGNAVQFDIALSPGCDDQTRKKLERPGCVSVLPAIPYRDMPAFLASADLLILPLDFDPESIKFARYSMPTKTPEFMISASPILVYAPAELAVTEYANREEWACIVPERSITRLTQALIDLIADQPLRERLGRHARDLALQNHDATQVRALFRQTLVNAMSN